MLKFVGGGFHSLILSPTEEMLNKRLPQLEKDRICRNNFYIISSVSPVSTITLRDNPFPRNEIFHVISFEYNFLNNLRNMVDGLTAILLHEIGHSLNPVPNSSTDELKEFYADDYVRYCGFANELSTNLNYCYDKLIEFRIPATINRLGRINAGITLLLNIVD